MTKPNLQNPFVGLRPYQSRDSLFYFGRNEQTKTLLRLLHQHRFVAVVGSSGAGKSSLIRAGLVPQLEAGFLVQARDQWLVASTKPGDSPLSNLVSSLLQALSLEGSDNELDQDLTQLIESINENGTQALIKYLEPVLANSDTNLFILVDQFEELFRFGLEKGKSRNRQEAEQYVALLLSLSRNDLPIYVCLTMRSDFLGDCDAFYGLPEAINKSQFLVPRLTRSQRQEVITHPVNLADARISQRLVDKLLNENIDTRDDLPILQHALMRTWDDWQAKGGQGELDVQHYENIHTIHKALDRHADEALEELGTDKQKHIAKVLFQALTTVDAGNRRIRRPVHLNEVCAISGASPEAVLQVIECFCEKNRSFLVLSSNETTDDPLIDISHESLIRQWKTLDQWVEEESEAAETYGRLIATSQRYKENKADLLRHVELEQALTWQKQLPRGDAAEIWANRYDQHFTEANEFLLLSEAAHIQKLAEEKEAREHQAKLLKEKADLEEQGRILAEEQSRVQKKSLIKTRWLSGIMAILTMIMLGVSWFAMQKSRELSHANLETKVALKNTTLANLATEKALKVSQKNEELATIAEAVSRTNEKKAELASKNAKLRELQANYNLAKAFEEKSLFSISRGNELSKRNPHSPEAIKLYRHALLYSLEAQHRPVTNLSTNTIGATLSEVSSIDDSILYTEKFQTPSLGIGTNPTLAYSPTNPVIASGSRDGKIRLWNTKSGQTLLELRADNHAINALDYSPAGDILVSGSANGTIRLWNIESGKKIRTIKTGSSPSSVVYNPDGKSIASIINWYTIQLWDIESGEIIKIITEASDTVESIVYSPSGDVLAAGYSNGTIKLRDTDTLEIIATLSVSSGLVNALAYTPDGNTLATGSSNNTISLWDIQTLKNIVTFKGHSESVNSVAFSSDAKVIASGSDDKTIRLWSSKSFELLETLTGHSDKVNEIVYSADSKTIASVSTDQTIKIWNPSSYKTHYSNTTNLGKNRDFTKNDSNKNSKSIPTLSEQSVNTFIGHTNAVNHLTYSPDGMVIASASEDNKIRIWDAKSGKTIKILSGHTSAVNSISFSPSGKIIASGSSDSTVRLWNSESGALIRTINTQATIISSLAFSPDGMSIAVATYDNSIQIWNVQSGESINLLMGHSDFVNSVVFSPKGEVLASGSSDKTVRLWDVRSGKTIVVLSEHSSSIYSLAYSPDGKALVAGSSTSLRIWDTKSLKLINKYSHNSSGSIAYSPDGKFVAASSPEEIKLWHADTGKIMTTITTNRGDGNYSRALAYSPNGKSIAFGSDDGSIRIWDIELSRGVNGANLYPGTHVDQFAYHPNGRILATAESSAEGRGVIIKLWDLESGKNTKVLKSNSFYALNNIVFSPNEEIIATTGYGDYNDNFIELWNIESGKVIKRLNGHSSVVSSLSFSFDGKSIASGSWDQTIKIWDTKSFNVIKTLEKHRGYITAVAYSPDKKVIASGSDDNTIRLWDTETGLLIKILKGHLDSINSLTYSPDGKLLASGASDNTIRIWSTKSLETVETLENHNEPLNSVKFSPDGKVMISNSSDGTSLLWETSSFDLIHEMHGVRNSTYSPDNKTIASLSLGHNEVRFNRLGTYIHNLIYRFDATEVSGVLKFLWELDLENLSFKHSPRRQSLIPIDGHHIFWTNKTRKYSSLLNMPLDGETKMDQVVKWLEKRCAYKQPDRYNCTPAKETEITPN